MIFTVLTATISSIHCIFSPNTSIYIINELPDSIRKTITARVLMVVVWTILIQAVWTNISFLIVAGTTYIVYFIPLVTTELYCATNLELKNLQFPNYLTNPSFRRPRTVRTIYRKLEISHKRILGFCSHILIPIQALTLQLVLFCSYVLFNHWRSLDRAAALQFFNWCLFASSTWSSILQLSGMIYVKSKRTLVSWKQKNWGNRWENRLMSKFRRSCKPLTIGYGKTFVIKRLTVLKFFKAVIRGIFRTLLMTKQKH